MFMKRQIFFGIIIWCLVVLSWGCSVKKQIQTRKETIKDSTTYTVDTSYHPKVVEIKIQQEEKDGSQELFISEEAFNHYIDSLFAIIDSSITHDQIYRTIIETKGLWDSDTSFLETTLARSHAVIEDGKLYHYLQQKDTTIKRRYDSLLQVISKERETWHSKEVLETSEKIKRSGFNIRLIVIIIVILIFAWIILKRLI